MSRFNMPGLNRPLSQPPAGPSDTSNSAVGTNVAVYSNVMTGVMEALKVIKLDEALVKFITDNREMWPSFGKMDSHKYRAWLMAKFREAGLSAQDMMVVFLFAGVIKNKGRILDAMSEKREEWQGLAWYSKVYEFYDKHTKQYVRDGQVSSKKTGYAAPFPVVNIPSCMPGMDILVYCLITSPESRSLEDLMMRPTACQLNLNAEMQEVAKEGYVYYWDHVVQGTKNTRTDLEAPKHREEYYKNPASDHYNLISVNLEEEPPLDANVGYTREEIMQYMDSITV